jgi:hypothetical protein
MNQTSHHLYKQGRLALAIKAQLLVTTRFSDENVLFAIAQESIARLKFYAIRSTNVKAPREQAELR